MTLPLALRRRLVHIWRLSRPYKLAYIFLIFVILISINNFLYKNHHTYQSGESDNSKSIFTKKFDTEHQGETPEPHVQELGVGVQEEENSANEVFDGDGSDKGKVQVEDNAANEVNSIEPDHDIPKSLFSRNTIFSNESLGVIRDRQRSNVLQLKDKSHPSRLYEWRNLSNEQVNKLSVLGRRLYLQESIGTVQNRNFTILIWKHGKSIENRLMKEYTNEMLDPFRMCSVRNCKITYEDSYADTADAVLIHLHRTGGPSTFPSRTDYDQRWIWISDESPHHTFMVAKDKDLSHYNGYFNWSMTYRMDSDIPVPYGRTELMTEAEKFHHKHIDYHHLNSKLVAVMGSNCGGRNKRWSYVKELKNYIEVDAYGGCGTLKCPGHFTKDCELLRGYKFYLAFENNDCNEYITEKVWWNAFSKGAVPVVMGGKSEAYRQILPPASFIHIDDFKSPHHLAKYLLSVAANKTKYMEYHSWRSEFKVLNEHGYLGSHVFHYCRICEALNFNDPSPKVYNQMEVFWNKETDCFPFTWETRMKET